MKVYTFRLIFVENAIELAKHYNFTYTDNIDFTDKDTYIIFGAHDADYAYKLLLYKYKYGTNYIIINSEQPSYELFNSKYYQQLLKVSRVADYNMLSLGKIKQNINPNAECCYFFDFPIVESYKNKKYDIVFVGTCSEYRQKVYDKLIEKYPLKNIYFDMCHKHFDKDKLTELLKNTKIVLNMPLYTDGILEIHRINKALSCGCIVVSTCGKEAHVNKLYEDYVHFTDNLLTFDYENCTEKMEYSTLKNLLYEKYNFNVILKSSSNVEFKPNNVILIVSRYNEDITWTTQFPNVIIYNKGNNVDINCIKLDNVGRESHTYYKYIVDNYENLTYSHYVFLQGYPFDHSPNLIKTLHYYINNENLNINFANISEKIINFDFKNGCIHHPGLPLVENYIKIFSKQPDKKIYSFGAGAQFIVSRETILKRPKTFYKNILNLLSKEVCPIEAYVLERLHSIIFS